MTTPTSTDRDRGVAYAMVAGQLALLAAIAVLPRRHDWPVPTPVRLASLLGQGAGMAMGTIAGGGLGSSLALTHLPADGGVLHTDGLYSTVRHPIYAGVLLAAGSRAVASGNRWSVAALVALSGLLHVKAGLEERRLRERYPEYEAYAARTPRLLPRVPGRYPRS